MSRTLFAAAIVVAAVGHIPSQAQEAKEYPWCLMKQGSSICVYNSVQECIRDKAGAGDFCNPNPWWVASRQKQPARRR